MWLLFSFTFSCLLSLSSAHMIPTCDQTFDIDLGKNKNWNWPSPNRMQEGVFICYQFSYSDYTYASVTLDFLMIGNQDGVLVKDNYGNQYAYGFDPYDPTRGSNQNLGPITVMNPPTGLVKKIQVDTTNFNPNKKPKDTCHASSTDTCGFEYSSLKQDDTYSASGTNGPVYILSAMPTTSLLVYDSNSNYKGPLGYTDRFESTMITLYCSSTTSSSTWVTFAEVDYHPPTVPTFRTLPPPVPATTRKVTQAGSPPTTKNNNNNGQLTTVPSQHMIPKMSSRLSDKPPLTTHPTFPTNPPTISPTVTTTDKVTEAPPLTAGSNNNGQPTTVSIPLTTPKMGSRLPVHFAVIIGLVCLLLTYG